MRHRFFPLSTRGWQSSWLVLLCLLSSGTGLAAPTFTATRPVLAQSLTVQDQEDLERLQQEANLAFTRATTLVSILLAHQQIAC